MPKAYYQCERCRVGLIMPYMHGDPRPEPKCCDLRMTYRGDGCAGKLNWPHGSMKRRRRRR